MKLDPSKLGNLLQAALAELHPTARVAAALAPLEPANQVRVIAIGKAAPAMARGALMSWGPHIQETLVVTTDDTGPAGLEVMYAGHPLPDERSILAAAACFGVATRADSLLVLISGGASSLVCAPALGVTLAKKRSVTRAMLKSGAPIADINIVRKHLSRIKGGGLARWAGDIPVVSLVMSDVVLGAVEDVGSGPTIGDTSTVAQAKRLVKKWAPRYSSLPFSETGETGENVAADIVVAPSDLARAMSSRLRQKDLDVRILPPSEAPVARLAREYLREAKRMTPGTALIRVAEPAVAVPKNPKARGGRSTHLAALVARELGAGYVFGAFATDGVDGSSGTGGAIVDGSFRERVGDPALARAIARFDTGPLHLEAGTAIEECPSGVNFADLHVLVRLEE